MELRARIVRAAGGVRHQPQAECGRSITPWRQLIRAVRERVPDRISFLEPASVDQHRGDIRENSGELG